MTVDAQLRQAILDAFDEGDLRLLCADIGVDYDAVKSGDNYVQRVASIIRYFRKHQQLGAFIEALIAARDHLAWLRDLVAPPGTPPDEPTPPAARAARERPAPGGVSIGHYTTGAATLGCLVRGRDEPDQLFLLSDFYGVCATDSPSRVGDPVLQPARVDGGGRAEDLIGTLAAWTTVRAEDDAAATNVSAALVAVRAPADVSPEIKGRGVLRGVRDAVPGAPVYMVGRTSGPTSGIVTRVDVAAPVPCTPLHVEGSTAPQDPWISVPFAGLIECTPMIERGDNGAILVDEENYALGMAFAGNDDVSLFLPIQRVLDALGVDLVTEETGESSRPQPVATADGPPPDLSRYARELDQVAEALERGRLVLFVGADLPAPLTGLPSRQALADRLAAQQGLPSGQPLAAVAQQTMRAGNRFEYTRLLKEQLERVDTQPGPFYTALADLIAATRPDWLVTTAYHHLLDRLLDQRGVSLNVVATDDQLRFLSADATLLHLYGEAQQPTSLVVTEQDQSALLRGSFPGKRDVVDEVRRLFRRHSVLFLGYDLDDPFVRILFDEVAGDTFQQRSFAVWPGLSEAQVQSLLTNRGLVVLDADPVAVLRALLDRVAGG